MTVFVQEFFSYAYALAGYFFSKSPNPPSEVKWLTPNADLFPHIYHKHRVPWPPFPWPPFPLTPLPLTPFSPSSPPPPQPQTLTQEKVIPMDLECSSNHFIFVNEALLSSFFIQVLTVYLVTSFMVIPV